MEHNRQRGRTISPARHPPDSDQPETDLHHQAGRWIEAKEDGDFVLIDIGTLNTRTGKVVLESLDEFRNSSARRTTVTRPWRMR